MTVLFGRTHSLKVGTRDFSSLDIAFSLTLTTKREPNQGEIQIFNASPASRLYLETTENLVAQLDAGYQGENATLFLGDVVDVETTREGPDIVTTLSCGDGEVALRRARSNRSYRSGTKRKTIVEGLKEDIKAAGAQVIKSLKEGNITELEETITGSMTVAGRTERELQGVLESAGLEWSVQQGQVQILQLGKAGSGRAVSLTSNSGLLNSPKRDSNGLVSAETMLIPGLFPGSRVVFPGTFTGNFRVEKAKYTGDTGGDEWTIAIECKPEAV